jgi:hypothetical protein
MEERTMCRTDIVYLKGHVGEWLPRQPQWQHWGELWLMHALSLESASRFIGGFAVDGDELWWWWWWWWCVAHMVAVDASVDECISR